MRAIMLKNNMFIDPLTGMNNFFSFIDADFNKVFGSRGIVLIIDIADFLKFNEKYGRDNGDLCLKTLSGVIQNTCAGEEASIFRTNGDEFTIILPDENYFKAEDISSKIKVQFNDIMDNNGFNGMVISSLIMNYYDSITSIESFYERLLENTLSMYEGTEDKARRNRLLRHTIKGFVSRVRDTISRYNDAYDLAVTDDVSGLSNHRAGKAYLLNLLEEYKSKNLRFSILFIDGDELKKYNSISYESGNQIIRKLSEIITISKRRGDRVFRWLSGDEFLVVLQDTGAEEAVKLAERIRNAVEEHTKDLIYPLTVSVGVASYPDDGSDIDDIINKAQMANALAKSLGKNRVVNWSK